MTVQMSIYDIAERKKQEGIELVYRNANTDWKRAAADRLREVIERQRTFTSDDILMHLDAKGIVTGDNRAIAAILQAAARVGLISATDKFIRCKRPSRHSAPIMVWESNVFHLKG